MAYPAYEASLEQIELPEPELVPGTALLEVLTCGICFSDVKTWLGQMPFSDELLFPSRYVRMDELQRAIQLVADGRVRMMVDAVKPFAEAGEALTALREGGVVGRLVVDVAGVT